MVACSARFVISVFVAVKVTLNSTVLFQRQRAEARSIGGLHEAESKGQNSMEAVWCKSLKVFPAGIISDNVQGFLG